MRSVLASWLLTLQTSFRARSALQLEILALRHRPGPETIAATAPPAATRADRLLWVWLSRVWDEWCAAVVVKPETVLAWHRQGFRPFWTWKKPAARLRSTGDRSGRPHADSHDGGGESALGCAENPRRTLEAWHRRQSPYNR